LDRGLGPLAGMSAPRSAAPHLAVPFTIGADGSAATVAQDSPAEIAQCVRVLLSTTVGSRVELPGYGVRDVTFTNGDTTGMVQAVAQWEPRATGITITTVTNPDGSTTIAATIPERGPTG